MAAKTVAPPIVSDHVHSLRDVGQERPRWWVIAAHYLSPIALGTAISLLRFRVSDGGQVIAGAAILAGFAFGLAVFVFQLRMESARDPRIDRGAYLLELLDELFANVLYLIVWGLVVVAVAIAATSFVHGSRPAPEAGEASVMNGWWTATLVALSVHYLATLLLCVRRLRRAYDELTI